jgi:hypothetical protein
MGTAPGDIGDGISSHGPATRKAAMSLVVGLPELNFVSLRVKDANKFSVRFD